MFFSNNIHSPCFYKVCVEHVCISTLMLALCSLAFAKGEVRLESVSLVQPVRAQQREGIARAHNLLNFGPPEGDQRARAQGSVLYYHMCTLHLTLGDGCWVGCFSGKWWERVEK
jgi:hypothetical protein